MDNMFIRFGRVKGDGGILKIATHNKREFKNKLKSHINPSRTSFNYSLLNNKSAKQISVDAKNLRLSAGICKLRKDAVQAVEIIFSLPSEMLQQNTTLFFEDCFEWIKNEMEGILISFDIHLDESAPHAHALILPLVNGRMIGSELIGYKAKLKEKTKSFFNLVGNKHGLHYNPKARLNKATKEAMINGVINKLQTDPVMQSKIYPCINAAIRNNPRPYAEILNVNTPLKIKNNRSFAQIMTSKGKGNDQENYRF